MNIWDKISNFINSDLYLYIWTGIMLAALIAWIVYKIIEHIYVNKGYEEWCNNLRKYGVPDELEAPKYVWNHIEHLIWLCEEYNLDSLYEAQDKFDELYTCHFKAIRVSDEFMESLQSTDSDTRNFAFKAFRHGGAVKRNNNLEELKKLYQVKFAGRYFFTEQRPSSSEDKPGEEV